MWWKSFNKPSSINKQTRKLKLTPMNTIPKPHNSELRVLRKINKRNQIRKSKISITRNTILFAKRGIKLQAQGQAVKVVFPEHPLGLGTGTRMAVFVDTRHHKIGYMKQIRAARKRKNRRNK